MGINSSHFAAPGKRVESAHEPGMVGTVIAWIKSSSGAGHEIIVQWDGQDLATACYSEDLDPETRESRARAISSAERPSIRPTPGVGDLPSVVRVRDEAGRPEVHVTRALDGDISALVAYAHDRIWIQLRDARGLLAKPSAIVPQSGHSFAVLPLRSEGAL